MSATRGNFFRNDLFDPDPFGDQEPAQPDPAPSSGTTTYQEPPEVIHYQAVPRTRVVEPTRLIAAAPAPSPVDEEVFAPTAQKRLSKAELRQQAVAMVKGNSGNTLSGAQLWGKAFTLAWKDPAGGKFTTKFTRRVIMMTPVFALDEPVGAVLAPVTAGTSLMVTVADSFALGIGALIYFRKVRKYHGMLDE